MDVQLQKRYFRAAQKRPPSCLTIYSWNKSSLNMTYSPVEFRLITNLKSCLLRLCSTNVDIFHRRHAQFHTHAQSMRARRRATAAFDYSGMDSSVASSASRFLSLYSSSKMLCRWLEHVMHLSLPIAILIWIRQTKQITFKTVLTWLQFYKDTLDFRKLSDEVFASLPAIKRLIKVVLCLELRCISLSGKWIALN